MKKNFDDLKKNAPAIPTNTCPYIDFAQQVLKEVECESNSLFIEKKTQLIDEILEYIRKSNDSLRKSSLYWYQKCNQLNK